jgi:hypothetical protein
VIQQAILVGLEHSRKPRPKSGVYDLKDVLRHLRVHLDNSGKIREAFRRSFSRAASALIRREILIKLNSRRPLRLVRGRRLRSVPFCPPHVD